MKNFNIGKVLLVVAIFLIIAGVALNFFLPTTLESNNNQNNNTKEQVVDDDKVKIPNNMEELSTLINEQLGTFILYTFDSTKDSGVDLLSNPLKRFTLVALMLEQENKVQKEETSGISYVNMDDFKTKYVEVYGSDENYDSDLEVAYTLKDQVNATLGEGYIAWNSTMPPVAIERTFTVTKVNYEKDSKSYIINGTYTENQLGAQADTGTFIMKYKDNTINSITLTVDNK